MHLVVRAYAVLPSKEPDVEAFARELAGPRRAEADAFYRGLGVHRETWHFQPGPFGAQVIVVTEVEDVERAARAFADAQQAFHLWFKDQVLRISAVDATTEPVGPATTQVFAWPPPSGAARA